MTRSRPMLRHKERMLKADPFCVWCHARLSYVTATVDHLLPRSKGGTNEPRNLALACVRCNSTRGNALAPPPSPFTECPRCCRTVRKDAPHTCRATSP
jgi:5-methylcytosine-specific restriction endonuclease McrA